MKTYLALN